MTERSLFGCVVIGRNEGQRLRRCLETVSALQCPIVYVDSGSSDGSPELAATMGASVIRLDPSRPFTAARARNEGWRSLASAHPDLSYVQFVDGDCELNGDWPAAAVTELGSDRTLAAVCGRRREKYPDNSRLNRMCDIEWNTPPGPCHATGGDAMYRLSALREVAGYRDTLIAGEEPELGFRLRRAGWRIKRVDHEMTLHDADMHTLRQWWLKSVRTGYAFAEGADLHGLTDKERYRVKDVLKLVLVAGVIPSASLLGFLPSLGTSTGLLAIYPLIFSRSYRATRRSGHSRRDALDYAGLTLVGKFAELQGLGRYAMARFKRRPSSIIEYK